MKQRILCLLTVFCIGFLTACGGNQQTGEETALEVNSEEAVSSEAPEKEVPQKDGFDEKTNSEVQLGNFIFSIPSYFEADITEDDHYRAYAEKGGKTAYVEIFAVVDEEDPVSYEALKGEVEDGSSQEAFGSWFESCDGVTTIPFESDVIQGFTFSTNYNTDGHKGHSECLSFPSVDDNRWFFVVLNQTEGTDYSYVSDFKKMQSAIKEVEKKDPWDLTGSWWEESVANGEPGMAAYIEDSTITVYHVTDKEYTRTPFWIGTYENAPSEESFSWVSEAIEQRANYPLLSLDETKDFNYSDKSITFGSSLGDKVLVRSDYDFSKDYRELPSDSSQFETSVLISCIQFQIELHSPYLSPILNAIPIFIFSSKILRESSSHYQLHGFCLLPQRDLFL